jgi:AraC-like DNA-binding protein
LESGHVDPFMEGLRELVARRLVGGHPPIRSTARAVAMSVRSLQRRLGERGWTYTELVDDVRRVIARQRVAAHPRRHLKVVAADLGFAEQASFTRAFRRWTGLTPREYRRRSRPHPMEAPASPASAGRPHPVSSSG